MVAKVVDASVLGALLFQEPRRTDAAGRLKGASLFAPSLLPYELASTARKKVLKYPGKRRQIIEALRIGMNLDIKCSDGDQAETTMLALDTGLSAYDAAYLWLARDLGAELVSFDQRLLAVSTGR